MFAASRSYEAVTAARWLLCVALIVESGANEFDERLEEVLNSLNVEVGGDWDELPDSSKALCLWSG